MLVRDVVTDRVDDAAAGQFVHLFANVVFGDDQCVDGGFSGPSYGCLEEDYQWLYHVTDDIAPVSADDATPCPSLAAARDGECLVVDVAYDPKYLTGRRWTYGS